MIEFQHGLTSGQIGINCLSCGKLINRPKKELRVYCLDCHQRSEDKKLCLITEV